MLQKQRRVMIRRTEVGAVNQLVRTSHRVFHQFGQILVRRIISYCHHNPHLPVAAIGVKSAGPQSALP